MEINAATVKELRERTGAGILDCKKALVAAAGDIEQAIDILRKSGAAKAAKKADTRSRRRRYRHQRGARRGEGGDGGG